MLAIWLGLLGCAGLAAAASALLPKPRPVPDPLSEQARLRARMTRPATR
jgi:hypothetical protein